VKRQVLVVDFDGTTSERDELDSEVRSALEEARRRGISTVLDTGRTRGRTIPLRLREQRRLTGLPHQIVVDKADHFLGGSEVDQLLDLELGGYTLITDRASKLSVELLGAMEAIVVTRERDAGEARALQAMCGVDDEQDWAAVLRRLPADHAVLLPITEESGGRRWPFRVAPRLTPHARYRHTDLDVPASRSGRRADRAGAQSQEGSRRSVGSSLRFAPAVIPGANSS